MYIPRIYQDAELAENSILKLSAEATKHLVRVLRMQVGDVFIVFNGKGGEFTAQINTVHKNAIFATIKQFIAKETESPLAVHLGQGISRGEKMDYVIQKAVELGVQKITPLITARCGVKLSAERWDKRLLHWRAIAIAACEQCGRNRLPEIFEPQPLVNWLAGLSSDLKLVCQPFVNYSLKSYTKSLTAIALLIGPESGLDEKEFAWAEQTGFKPLSLGPRVLRTETAAMSAITAIQTYFGDMG